MATVTVNITCGRRVKLNSEGHIDGNAEKAFTCGQCHALALALHRLTGWKMYGTYNSDYAYKHKEWNTPSHVLVQTPDGEFIDINGKNALENWQEIWPSHEAYPVTEEEVLRFSDIDYVEPNVEAAMPYALTLAVKFGNGQAVQSSFPFAR